MSAFIATLAPVVLAISAVSPVWSGCPWVTTIRSTGPSLPRSFRASGVFGFLVMNGSTRMTLPPGVVILNADWPNHWISAALAVPTTEAQSTAANAIANKGRSFIDMGFPPDHSAFPVLGVRCNRLEARKSPAFVSRPSAAVTYETTISMIRSWSGTWRSMVFGALSFLIGDFAASGSGMSSPVGR